MAKRLDLEIDQGSDTVIGLNWIEDGVSVDLTGYTAIMHVRYKNSSELALECSTMNTKIALSTYDIVITISASDTYALEIKDMVYDLILQKGSITRKIIHGKVTMNKLITLYEG